MNEINPGAPPIPAPKTSPLAIWSLVLGILSLICFSIFAGIPGVICGHKALSQIKRSGGLIAGQGLAIGGLVTGYIGIAWAVIAIPLMLAIAIPNFVKARSTAQMNACINNLRQIDAAIQQWTLENNKSGEDVPTVADLNPYIKGGFNSLHCPADGTYTINKVNAPPTCSITNHQLHAFVPSSVPGTQSGVRVAPFPNNLRQAFPPRPSGPPNFGQPPTQSMHFAQNREVAEPAICKVRLRQINSAKRIWALRYQKLPTDVPTVTDLLPFLPGRQLPICPAHGTYTIGPVGELPTCSVPGHQLPESKPMPGGAAPVR